MITNCFWVFFKFWHRSNLNKDSLYLFRLKEARLTMFLKLGNFTFLTLVGFVKVGVLLTSV